MRFPRPTTPPKLGASRLALCTQETPRACLPSLFPPQPLLTAQSFVQCQGLQLIHDAGAYLHHAVPVPQQLPQIPVLPAWYPNLRKVILQHESQNQLCILSIGLLFAHSFALDLGRVANPQLELQLGQQSFEPACMPTGFHSNTHLLARQCPVERFRVLTMC